MSIIELGNEFIFRLGDDIGCGSTCKVYKGVNVTNGTQIACKYLAPKTDVHREIDSLQKLKNENIVSLIARFTNDLATQHIIVMEYCNLGSLHHQIELHNGLDDDWLLAVLQCLYKSYEHLREKSLIHRDIKPSNLLVHVNKAKLSVKLGDLGSACSISNENERFVTLQGTEEFLHPDMQSELLRKINPDDVKKTFSAKCDLWSIAVTLYHAICNQPPFLLLTKYVRDDCQRELMRAMYEQRLIEDRQDCIRGRQLDSEQLRVDWRANLPNSRCKLSTTLRPYLEQMLVKLMQQRIRAEVGPSGCDTHANTKGNDDGHWGYKDFFEASRRVLALTRVPVFYVNTGQMEFVYLPENSLTCLVQVIKRDWLNSTLDDAAHSEFFLFHSRLGLLSWPKSHSIAWRLHAEATPIGSNAAPFRFESIFTGQFDFRLSNVVGKCVFLVSVSASRGAAALLSRDASDEAGFFEKDLEEARIIDEPQKLLRKKPDDQKIYSNKLMADMYAVRDRFRHFFDEISGYCAAIDTFLHSVLTTHYFSPANTRLRLSSELLDDLEERFKMETDVRAEDERKKVTDLLQRIYSAQKQLEQLPNDIVFKWSQSNGNLQLSNQLIEYDLSMEYSMKEMERVREEIKLIFINPQQIDNFKMEIWPRFKHQADLYKFAKNDILEKCRTTLVNLRTDVDTLLKLCFDWIEKLTINLTECNLNPYFLVEKNART